MPYTILYRLPAGGYVSTQLGTIPSTAAVYLLCAMAILMPANQKQKAKNLVDGITNNRVARFSSSKLLILTSASGLRDEPSAADGSFYVPYCYAWTSGSHNIHTHKHTHILYMQNCTTKGRRKKTLRERGIISDHLIRELQLLRRRGDCHTSQEPQNKKREDIR